MDNHQNSNKHVWDLESRTTELAKRIIRLCKELPRNPINDRLVSQIVGSGGSIGANYREANDALGKQDFIHRLRIARKEAKETLHWLECLIEANEKFASELRDLMRETNEIKNIISSIISKVQ